MGKQKPAGGDKPDDNKTGMIRVSASTAKKLAVIALADGTSIRDAIEPHLAPIVDKLYRAALKKLGKDTPEGDG